MDTKQATKQIRELMDYHALKNWAFRLDNAKRRFGCCNHHKRVISMSRHLIKLNDWSEVEQTALHEIAHALTPGHGHDHVWRGVARHIGHTGERCYDARKVKRPEPKYVGKCLACGSRFQRERMPRGGASTSCSRCDTKYNPEFKIHWQRNPAA